MVITIRLFSKLLLIILLSFQFANAMANTGKAFIIQGTAVINGSELRSGDTIREGDILKTGTNSSVKIIMKDRTVLDIGENTRFEITKYIYNKEEPAKNRSIFTLLGMKSKTRLKGAFRYISGLIAKHRPQNVQVGVGTATIGVRGSFDSISFDGTTITVKASIGTAIFTFANGEEVTIASGKTGIFDISTGESSVITTTSPDPAAQAAKAIAQNPDDAANVALALSDLSNAEALVAMAVLINNASQLGVDDSGLISAIGHAAAANPSLAVVLAYVSSALSPENSQSFIDAISEAVPDQGDAIQEAGDAGTDLGQPPSSGSTDGSPGTYLGGTVGGGGGGGGGVASPVNP